MLEPAHEDAAAARISPPAAGGGPGGDGAGGRLMNRNFLLLWQGQLVSRIGNQAFAIAMMFWTREATGSASLMGILMMLGTLPVVLLGPLAGTLADRVSRKWILVGCDALSGLVMLGLAVPFFLPGVEPRLLVVCLALMALSLGILQAFFLPASTAAIPDLVPKDKVAAANGLDQGSLQLSNLVGQSLGGVLFRLLGAPLLFVFDGITYLLSALSESFIRLAPPEKKEETGSTWEAYRRDLIEGLRYVWDDRGMRGFLLLAAAVNFFAMPILVLLPFLVSDNLGQGADWYGFLLAGFGFGALVGYGVAGGVRLRPESRSWVLLASLAASATLLGGLGFVHRAWVALGLMVAIGALNGFFNILVVTAFQFGAKEELRGRVMGVVTTVAMAVAPLGMALGGLAGDLTGKNLPLLYGLCGGFVLLATAVFGLRRPVREFLAFSVSDSAETQVQTLET